MRQKNRTRKSLAGVLAILALVGGVSVSAATPAAAALSPGNYTSSATCKVGAATYTAYVRYTADGFGNVDPYQIRLSLPSGVGGAAPRGEFYFGSGAAYDITPNTWISIGAPGYSSSQTWYAKVNNLWPINDCSTSLRTIT